MKASVWLYSWCKGFPVIWHSFRLPNSIGQGETFAAEQRKIYLPAPLMRAQSFDLASESQCEHGRTSHASMDARIPLNEARVQNDSTLKLLQAITVRACISSESCVGKPLYRCRSFVDSWEDIFEHREAQPRSNVSSWDFSQWYCLLGFLKCRNLVKLDLGCSIWLGFIPGWAIKPWVPFEEFCSDYVTDS